MTAQGLNPSFVGTSETLESGATSMSVSISSGGITVSYGLYDGFDPSSFADTFGFNLHEDEVYEEGDYCIRTKPSDDYLALGTRNTVLVTR